MTKWSEESHRRMLAQHHDAMSRAKYRGYHPGAGSLPGPVAKVFATVMAVFMVLMFLLVFAGIGLFIYLFVTVGLPMIQSATPDGG